MTRQLLIFAWWVLAPLAAFGLDAYEVAGWAPKESVAVMAWAGANQTAEAFAQSELGKFYNTPSIKRFLTTPIKSGYAVLREMVVEEAGEERTAMIEAVLLDLWRQPGMVCVVDSGDPEAPAGVLLIWRMEQAGERLARINEWIEQEGEPKLTEKDIGGTRFLVESENILHLGTKGDRLIVAVGEMAARAAVEGGASFNDNPVHQRARQAMGDLRPFSYTCVDVSRLRQMSVAAVALMARGDGSGDENMVTMLGMAPAMIVLGQAIGTATAGGAEMATIAGFDGAELRTAAYARSDPKHPFPLDYLGHQPVDLGWLKQVPADTMQVSVASLDVSEMYESAIDLVEWFWNQVGERVPKVKADKPEDIRAKIREELGMDPKAEILDHFGNQVMYYTQKGLVIPRMVGVVEVKNAAAIREQIEKLMAMAGENLRFREERIGAYTLQAIDMAAMDMGPVQMFNISPCWAVTENRLMVALDLAAGKQYLAMLSDTPGASLADDPRITKLLEERKGERLTGLYWMDEDQNWEMAYSWLALLYVPFTQEIRKGEPRIKWAPMPTLMDMLAHMDQSVAWTVAEGDVRVRHGVGTMGSAEAMGTVAGMGIGVSIALPSLARARELSKRTVCAANLKGIGVAVHTHANENDDQFPGDLKTLIEEGHFSEKSLICPSDPKGGREGHVSYIYIPGQTTEMDPRNVLAYEPAENHGGEGGNVLFADGHAQFIAPYSRVEEAVAETRERLKAASQPATEP